MTNTIRTPKTLVVNGVSVQLSFAPKENEQIPQLVLKLLKTVYLKHTQEAQNEETGILPLPRINQRSG